MAYTPFDAGLPDVSVGSRKDNFDAARNNETAVADMLAAFAGMQGFDKLIVSETADGPTEITATNAMQVVKKEITYGTGATAGLPVQIDYSKSTNGGGAYDSIATLTLNYDGSGNFTDSAWS